MRRSSYFFWLLLLVSVNSMQGQATDQSKLDFISRVVPVYTFHESSAAQTVLEMAYASSEIKYPRMWTEDVRSKEVYEVDLVFTNYPSNKADWLTNYDTLLYRRLHALYALIPELKDNKEVRWNMVLQTDCPNENVAKERFHGAVVKYRIVLNEKIKKTIQRVRDIVNGNIPFPDSVVFKTFERNPDWVNMLVVNDWTGSMYPYGAQAVLWHRLQMKTNPRIRQFVFFNDGDLMPEELKLIGRTGGIYFTPADSLSQIARTMKEVMISGYGGDDPENDLEAVWKAIRKFPEYGQVVLVADNKSAVRDLELLEKLDFPPIRIVLCGASAERPIHPDYLAIAQKTGGSLHTIEEDLENLFDTVQEGDIIRVLDTQYRLVNGEWKIEE